MTTFIPAPGLEEAIAHSEGVRAVLHEKADRAAEIARQTAPVDPESPSGAGAFRDSIHVVEDGDGYAIVADSVDDQGNPNAAYIEMGTGDTPAHGTLLHAIEALGSE